MSGVASHLLTLPLFCSRQLLLAALETQHGLGGLLGQTSAAPHGNHFDCDWSLADTFPGKGDGSGLLVVL